MRDVADLHIRAMTDPAAKGQRFLTVAGDFLSMLNIAKAPRANLGPAAARVPNRELPDWLLRLIALFDPQIRQVAPEFGKRKNASNEKARRLLGWNPRSNEECIVATAHSLIDLGLI